MEERTCSNGPALKAVPKISRNFIAYLCGMAIVASFCRGPADRRVQDIAESHAETIFKIMKPVKHNDYVAFLARKLGEWYKGWPHA